MAAPDYQETATCILVIMGMVIVADMISSQLRHRIQKSGRH